MLALISSPLFIMLIVFLLLAFVLYSILSYAKRKRAKIEKIYKKESEAASKETDAGTEPGVPDDAEAKEPSSEEITQSDTEQSETTEVDEDAPKPKKKHKYIKKQAKVEQVFKKTETAQSEEAPKEIQPDISEDELFGRMQFVSTSKKVSKLRKLSEEEQAEIAEAERVKLAEQISGLELDPIEIPKEEFVAHEKEKNSKYFDRSRRISRCIECGSFDDMFCTHITDSYMNINIDRHLNVNDDFTKSLYTRTSEMLANSNAKIISSEEREQIQEDYDDFLDDSSGKKFTSSKDSMKDWLEKRRREEMAKLIIDNDKQSSVQPTINIEPDELDLSAKNIMLVSSIMNRKSAKKRA